MSEKNICEEAAEIFKGERQDMYGSPEDSFAVIAEGWSAYLDCKVDAQDVACMMAIMKACRESNKPKRDNMVDIVGYMLCQKRIRNNTIDLDPDDLPYKTPLSRSVERRLKTVYHDPENQVYLHPTKED